MKQRILSLFRSIYQVVFSFRSCTTCEAMASPDVDGWKDAIDQEMVDLKSYGVYELVPHERHAVKLGWLFHRKF